MSYHGNDSGDHSIINTDKLAYASSTSSSDYDDEMQDVVADFNITMRKMSSTVRQNFVMLNENKRSQYEQFDEKNTHDASTGLTQKLKSKISQSIRNISFR